MRNLFIYVKCWHIYLVSDISFTHRIANFKSSQIKKSSRIVTGGTLRFLCHVPLLLLCFLNRPPPLLFQMELQDDGVMLGLDSSLGKDIVGIINNVFQAPWGGSHTCQKDEKALECSLCQSSILCYQLGCELLERLTPRDEMNLVVRHTACIN